MLIWEIWNFECITILCAYPQVLAFTLFFYLILLNLDIFNYIDMGFFQKAVELL